MANCSNSLRSVVSSARSVQLDSFSWFKSVTGHAEKDWLLNRANNLSEAIPSDHPEIPKIFGPHLFVGGVFPSSRWNAGAFRVWSIAELEQQILTIPEDTSISPYGCIFEIHTRKSRQSSIKPVEVSVLQTEAAADGSAMFQVN